MGNYTFFIFILLSFFEEQTKGIEPVLAVQVKVARCLQAVSEVMEENQGSS